MIYRVVCTFHPEVAVFPYPRKGAWRVRYSYPLTTVVPRPIAVRCVGSDKAGRAVNLLIVNSVRPRQHNSWVSPFKVVKEWLEAQR